MITAFIFIWIYSWVCFWRLKFFYAFSFEVSKLIAIYWCHHYLFIFNLKKEICIEWICLILNPNSIFKCLLYQLIIIVNFYFPGMHWCSWFLPLICIILAIVIYSLATSKDFSVQNISLSDVKTIAKKNILRVSKASVKFWHASAVPFVLSVKASLMKNIHSIMVYISNTASKIELLLSVYL